MMRTKRMLVVYFITFILGGGSQLAGQAASEKAGEWQPIEQALGRSGQAEPDGAYKVSFPRSDLKVTVNGVELKPALALGGWVAFSKPGADSMIMGDLVLAEDEVTPVMSSLESNGLQVTALHNHVLHESPRVMYMHIGGHGDALKLPTPWKQPFALAKLTDP